MFPCGGVIIIFVSQLSVSVRSGIKPKSQCFLKVIEAR